MANSADDRAVRRSTMIDRMADHMLSHGLDGSSLRPLAAAAGVSDRMLLYHFRDKADVLAVTLERVAARMAMLLDDRVPARCEPVGVLTGTLIPVLLAADFWPYMRLWLAIAGRAAFGDPFYGRIGEQIGRGFLAWGEARIAAPTPQMRARDAARLLVTVEGVMLLKSIGMADVGEAGVAFPA